MNPRDIAGKAEEEEEWYTPEIKLGNQKKKNNGEPQSYSWEGKRIRNRRKANTRDIAVNAQSEEEW